MEDNPWGPTGSARELGNIPGNRSSYQEPSFSPVLPQRDHVDLTDGPSASSWTTPNEATYPPAAANPFNAPRNSIVRTLETPKKGSHVRLSAPSADEVKGETPLSSPGLDGPLTYSWQPKADIVLGVAVVDFNHLVSSRSIRFPKSS